MSPGSKTALDDTPENSSGQHTKAPHQSSPPMQLANVLGTVTATVKHSSLAGAKLLVVQPLMADRTKADGDPQLAIDTVAAGVGDLVMITSDGRLLRDILKSDATPARYSVVALVDDVTDFSSRKQDPTR